MEGKRETDQNQVESVKMISKEKKEEDKERERRNAEEEEKEKEDITSCGTRQTSWRPRPAPEDSPISLIW